MEEYVEGKKYLEQIANNCGFDERCMNYLESIDWQVSEGFRKKLQELQKLRSRPIVSYREVKSIVENMAEIAERYGNASLEVLKHFDRALNAYLNNDGKNLVNLSVKIAGFAKREGKLASNGTQFIFDGFKQRLEDALNNCTSTKQFAIANSERLYSRANCFSGEEKWRR